MCRHCSKPSLRASYNKGTWQFMARGVLLRERHERKHNLESFYWLLVWVLLCHTHHNQQPSKAREVFNNMDNKTAAALKWAWLTECNLDITENGPLTSLLGELRKAFRYQQSTDLDQIPRTVTHKTFLSLINDALQQTGWPIGDKARPLDPYTTAAEQKSRAKGIVTGSSSVLTPVSLKQMLSPGLASESTKPTLDSDLASGSTKPTLNPGLVPKSIIPMLASGLVSGSSKRRFSTDMDHEPDSHTPPTKSSKRRLTDHSLDSNLMPAAGKKPARTSSSCKSQTE
jgi:hypothetical protein